MRTYFTKKTLVSTCASLVADKPLLVVVVVVGLMVT
jgi:hypothetical protein